MTEKDRRTVCLEPEVWAMAEKRYCGDCCSRKSEYIEKAKKPSPSQERVYPSKRMKRTGGPLLSRIRAKIGNAGLAV